MILGVFLDLNFDVAFCSSIKFSVNIDQNSQNKTSGSFSKYFSCCKAYAEISLLWESSAILSRDINFNEIFMLLKKVKLSL
jgi:hypothetical protein